MKIVNLFICILIVFKLSEASAQETIYASSPVRHGDVVDNVPVKLYNDIIYGWRASENEVSALREERAADSTVIALKNAELRTKDSTTAKVTILYVGCSKALEKQKEISAQYFEVVKKGCPPQRKPLLLNPWTYVGFAGAFVTGVYVGSRAR